MTTKQLLELINAAYGGKDLLEKLAVAGFAVNDKTEEGDSLLHVIAKSKHTYNFSYSFIKDLLQAGVDTNAVNAEGVSVLTCFCNRLVDAPYFLAGILEDKNLDVNLTTADGVTVFEMLVTSETCNLNDLMKRLIGHSQFNPMQIMKSNQTVAFYMLEKNGILYLAEWMQALLARNDFDPNITNAHGLTLMSVAIRQKLHGLDRIFELFHKHEKFDHHYIDEDGNNYLQQLARTANYYLPEISKLLLTKIDLEHRNMSRQSVFDMVDYTNHTKLKFILKLCEKNPALVFIRLLNGNLFLQELMVTHASNPLMATFIQLGKQHSDADKLFVAVERGMVEKYHSNRVLNSGFLNMLKLFIAASITINVEYAYAVLLLKGKSSSNEDICKQLLAIRLPDKDKVMAYVKDLLPANSRELQAVLASMQKDELKARFKLDCFDEDLITMEQGVLRNEDTSRFRTDTVMLGHLFSLSGSVPCEYGSCMLTGSHNDESSQFMSYLMNAYYQHCKATDQFAEHHEALRQVRNMTVKSMRYVHMLSSGDGVYSKLAAYTRAELIDAMLQDSRTHGVEIITGWRRHAIGIVIKGEHFYRDNGGGCSTDATTEEYSIGKPAALTTAVLQQLSCDSSLSKNKKFIQQDLHQILGLALTGKQNGVFQTVGNCSVESKRISLLSKLRLFLPDNIAADIFAHAKAFMADFYLQEYISLHAGNPNFPYTLMRLILGRLIPKNKLSLAAELINKHLTNKDQLEIMHVEWMLELIKRKSAGEDVAVFIAQLESIGIKIDFSYSPKVAVLHQLLTDGFNQASIGPVTGLSPVLEFHGWGLLHLAVMLNNQPLVEHILKIFSEVNLINWFEQDVLSFARTPAMVALLVKAGAKTDRVMRDNALDHAIQAEDLPLVTAMLQAGVKPSKYSFFYAATRHPGILFKLVESYPQHVNSRRHNKSNAVHAAAAAGHTQNLHILIYYGGANPDGIDINGVSPMHLALMKGHIAAAKILVESPSTLFSFNAPHRGDAVLDSVQDASLKQKIVVTQKQKQIDLQYFRGFIKDEAGVVMEEVDNLIIAIRCDDFRAIRGCLLAYPDIKVVNFSKHYCISPLDNAVLRFANKDREDYAEGLEIIKLLFKTPGINVNALMATSEPTIFMATSMDDVNVLECFLADPKLQPNQQDNVGYTALHDAAERGHLDCVLKLLADERVDSMILNHDNNTAAEVAKKHGTQGRQIREAILAHQARSQRIVAACGK
jgi:ankyrin repeat protein